MHWILLFLFFKHNVSILISNRLSISTPLVQLQREHVLFNVRLIQVILRILVHVITNCPTVHPFSCETLWLIVIAATLLGCVHAIIWSLCKPASNKYCKQNNLMSEQLVEMWAHYTMSGTVMGQFRFQYQLKIWQMIRSPFQMKNKSSQIWPRIPNWNCPIIGRYCSINLYREVDSGIRMLSIWNENWIHILYLLHGIGIQFN